MKLTNAELCDLIDIPPHRLYKRCGLHDGNHFAWLTREIAINDWHGIGYDGRKYLTGILKILFLSPHMRTGDILNELIINNDLVYRIPYINELARIYAQRSPFITQKKGRN